MASTLRRRRKTPAYLATEGRKHASKQRSTNFSHGEVHMTQKAELELPEEIVGEHYLEESSPFPSARTNSKHDSLAAKNAAASGPVDEMTSDSFGARGSIRRS